MKHLFHFLLLSAAFTASSWVNAQGLTLERWTGISGTSMNTLYSAIGTRAPNTTVVQNGPAEMVQSSPNVDNFGARLRGTLTIPADGQYTFFVSGDDDVDLWLSTDASRFNKKRIAYNRGYTSLRNFTQNASQKSRTFSLKQGQVCYIEGLEKEGGGSDHLSLGWSFSPSTPLTTQVALGSVTSQSWTTQTDGSMLLSADGGDISGASDNAAFNYRTWSGNGDFVVKIAGMTVPHSYVKTGLMLRTSTDTGAQMVSLVQTSAGNMLWQRRTAIAANLSNTTYTGTFPWLKLHRDGDVITSYVSIDGQLWFSPGNVTITGLSSDILVGVCATDGNVSGHIPVTATVSDFRASPLTLTPTVIDTPYLTPVTADPADANDDGLPDAWQVANGLSATGHMAGSGQYDDPDGDGLSNLDEYQRGLAPLVPSRVPGSLSLQRWLNTAYYNVSELVLDSHFLSPADSLEIIPGVELHNIATYCGTRARGYLTAPATGSYRFWVTGCDGVELWLSTDSTKYRKQKLCGFGADTGAGNGINDGTNPFSSWDTFSAQLSAPVQLVAGQKYFFEILGTSTHSGTGWFSAAWSRDGGTREIIPSQYLESYAQEAEDADDDYLPDAWEAQYGLNIHDNGLMDRTREGELGDFDGDGLTNRQEYLLGTNPNSKDTDGDGVSDFDEVNFYHTSPKVSNALTQTTVDSPPLTSYNPLNTTGTWQVFDGGLMGDLFRGHIEYTFTVPTDGWWVVDVEGRLRGTLRAQEDLPVNVLVDGSALAPQVMSFSNGAPSSLKVVTPFITAGSHHLLLDIPNDIGRRKLQIQALKILSAGGFDGDGNGRSDWLDALLANADRVAPYAAESVVSPAFIEGGIRYVGGAAVQSSGQSIPVQRGLGDLHWFANVPLAQNGATPFTSQFENASITQNNQVTWTRWNALGGAGLTVRVGDTVKIGAWKSTTDTGTSSIVVAGGTHAGVGAASGWFLQTFPTAGSFTVATTHSTGTKGSVVITVVGADFGQPQAFYADWATWRTFTTVPTALWADSEPSLIIANRAASGSGQQLQLLASREGVHAVAARIGANGPIVNVGSVSTVGISDALRNDATEYIGSTGDGYQIVRSPIVVSYLPPGGKVVITIFRAGVTFLDGTTVRTLTSADFTEGVCYLDFRYPQGMSGGFCHYIDVYDSQNRYLGRH